MNSIHTLVAIFLLQVTLDGLELNGALCISGSGTLTGEGSKKGGVPRYRPKHSFKWKNNSYN